MATNKTLKMILKSGMLISAAGLMMGNESCEQAAQTRELKRIVEMGRIVSPSINLPQGGSFDFEFVANQQVYAVLQNSEHFALRYESPVETVASSGFGDSKYFNVSNDDQKMMKVFAANAGALDKPQYSKEAECMINLPSARIAGSVNAFELIGGGGINIGFTPAGAHNVGGLSELGINVQWSQLDLSMMATNPLSAGLLAAANVNSKQTRTQVNFALNVGAFRIGPSAYYQTPLAKVTEKALKSATDTLYNQLKSKEEWYSRVLLDHDTHLVMLGGNNVNVKVGDQFKIYNETYYWEGEPCNSKYYGGGAKDPVASIQIDWVGDEIARGKVISQTDEPPVLGAKVKILKLFTEPAQKAAK